MLQRLGSKLVKHKGATLYEKLESLEEAVASLQGELKAAKILIDKMQEDTVRQNTEDLSGASVLSRPMLLPLL